MLAAEMSARQAVILVSAMIRVKVAENLSAVLFCFAMLLARANL